MLAGAGTCSLACLSPLFSSSACRFPCNVLAGFEKDCGATYFDLTYLQVGSTQQAMQLVPGGGLSARV